MIKTMLHHKERVMKPVHVKTWEAVRGMNKPGEHYWQTMERILRAGIKAERDRVGGAE